MRLSGRLVALGTSGARRRRSSCIAISASIASSSENLPVAMTDCQSDTPSTRSTSKQTVGWFLIMRSLRPSREWQ